MALPRSHDSAPTHRLSGPQRLGLFAITLALGVPALSTGDEKFLQDFEFLQRTVQSQGASIRSKRIDWSAACARLRPDFEASKSDVEHVRCVLRLLAVLEDSHTGVLRSKVEDGQLPSKWDGLYGGGLWFAWEDGRVMLRGIMKSHPLQGRVPEGSVLVEIDGVPAWLALAREKRRITEYQGVSSDHSLFSSMGNRFLPFGDRQTLDVRLLTPELELSALKVPRWGTGGKAFYPYTVELPDGLEWKEGAISTMLSFPWCAKVGYLRITGSMDARTVTAVHEAFDALRGMEALLLDCRGMGGGGDSEAWEMAGRLFAQKVPNGPGRALEPTGSWQFQGPVVMLQDELEVSSAETFTWAVSETERVVSVGRPTGGWGIIPRVFELPSGLATFRLGVNDRPTPIRRVRTEGVGWPPDLLVPYGPVFCAKADPDRELGLEVLQVLHAGVDRKTAVELFGRVLGGDVRGYLSAASRIARKVPGWDPKPLAADVLKDLQGTLLVEIALLESSALASPDAASALRRLDGLLARAAKAKLTAPAAKLKKLAAASKAEAAAQNAFLDFDASDAAADPRARAAFLKQHGKTRIARHAADLWR